MISKKTVFLRAPIFGILLLLASCQPSKDNLPLLLNELKEGGISPRIHELLLGNEYGLTRRVNNELFRIDSNIDTKKVPWKTYTLSYYLSNELPVEIIIGETNLSSQKEAPHVHMIRLGLAFKDGNLFIDQMRKTRAISNQDGKILDLESYYEIKFWEEISKLGDFLPYGITSEMGIDEVKDILATPYFSYAECFSSDDTGFLDFSVDRPDAPFPIRVWFYHGKISGVDIACSGITGKSGCIIPQHNDCRYRQMTETYLISGQSEGVIRQSEGVIP